MQRVLRHGTSGGRVPVPKYGLDGAHRPAHHRQVKRRHGGAVDAGGQLGRQLHQRLHRLAVAVPRGDVQRRVPAAVPAAEKLLSQPPVRVVHVTPGQPDDGFDRAGVPGPRRAVEGRVQRGVGREEERAVAEADLGDEVAVALACGDVEQRAAVRGHLPGAAARSMLSA